MTTPGFVYDDVTLHFINCNAFEVILRGVEIFSLHFSSIT